VGKGEHPSRLSTGADRQAIGLNLAGLRDERRRESANVAWSPTDFRIVL